MSSPEPASLGRSIRRGIAESIAVATQLTDESQVTAITAVVVTIVDSLRTGGKLLLCGNGGSAADAQHLAAEFVGRFRLDRRPLPAICLSDNIAAVTAIGNDYAFKEAFARSVEALGCTGDVLVALSTSGTSPNVVAAIGRANALGLTTVALIGGPASPAGELAAQVIGVDSPDTARIQEAHILVGHVICEMVERELCQP